MILFDSFCCCCCCPVCNNNLKALFIIYIYIHPHSPHSPLSNVPFSPLMMRYYELRRPIHVWSPFSLYAIVHSNLILLYGMYRTPRLIAKKIHCIQYIFCGLVRYIYCFLILVYCSRIICKMLCINENVNKSCACRYRKEKRKNTCHVR